ncbi:MAG: glycosyltransferase [Bdellovibrionota bacterium]|nr:MAG: glycosyltransferase [Bdellovibrionota bacterium]
MSTPRAIEHPLLRRSRFLFVVPRFGDEIGGGAETLVGCLAKALSQHGIEVEVWATCAQDHRTWQNAYPAGRNSAHGVPVERFTVDSRNLDLWVPLQLRIADGVALTIDEELTWMEQFVNSQALYAALQDRGAGFDAIFFAPYMFATTFWGAQIHPQRSYLIPCLHNEPYAYLQLMRVLFRTVRGCIFNAAAERVLAERIYGPLRGAEVGMGFHAECQVVSEGRPLAAPYLLYLGRKEGGKNLPLLARYFLAAKDGGLLPGDLRLVILGGGSLDDCGLGYLRTRDDIVDVPQAPEEDKRRYIEHAIALCQPSLNESFSIVLMEAWLRGTPVLVHGDCAVTTEHVAASCGGAYFRNFAEFVGAVLTLSEDGALRSALGQRGRQYVVTKYSWDAVLDRFAGFMLAELSAPSSAMNEAAKETLAGEL